MRRQYCRSSTTIGSSSERRRTRSAQRARALVFCAFVTAYTNKKEQAVNFVRAAFEASVLVAPRDHGLTEEELLRAGETAGYKRGLLKDALASIEVDRRANGRLQLPSLGMKQVSSNFNAALNPEVRNRAAFQFVREALEAEAEEHGAQASLARDDIAEGHEGLVRCDLLRDGVVPR